MTFELGAEVARWYVDDRGVLTAQLKGTITSVTTRVSISFGPIHHNTWRALRKGDGWILMPRCWDDTLRSCNGWPPVIIHWPPNPCTTPDSRQYCRMLRGYWVGGSTKKVRLSFAI